MIKSTKVSATNVSVPEKVYTSTTTGAPIGGSVTGQVNAITTMILCNLGAPTITDESVNTCNVSVFLVKAGDTPDNDNIIVNTLIVPAGETVFFSDEKILHNNLLERLLFIAEKTMRKNLLERLLMFCYLFC